jgi:hypothetical protein
VRPLLRVLALLFVISCFSRIASADTIGVGELTYDALPAATFDITNLTGANSAIDPIDFPISTQLTITVTSLVANVQGGGPITISGSDFTVADAQDDLNCTVAGDAGTGGCDFSAYTLLSATLTGTLSPLTGLAGLPAGDTKILGTFTATILPNAGCGPKGDTGTTLTAGCDAATINATGVNPAAVPEPATWMLFSSALIGLLVGCKATGNRTKSVR